MAHVLVLFQELTDGRLSMIDNTDWFDEAPCKGQTQLFFAQAKEGIRERRARERKAIFLCLSCPHMIKCRDYARKNREYGIWGGETEEQRLSKGYTPYRFRGKKKKTT